MRFMRFAGKAIIATSLVCAASGNARAQAAPTPRGEASAPALRPSKLAALGWLSGHWVGTAGENTTDEVCSQPTDALMLCMFHVGHAGKTLWIEFDTYSDTPEGIVEHISFLTPELQQYHLPVATLRGRIAAPDKFIYENPGGEPKSITVTRVGTNGFVSRVETTGADGKSAFHDNTMHRVQ